MKQNAERPPNLRRAYFESRFGQLHCRTAFPSTGGFDELTPLVVLHDAPGSGAALIRLLPLLGRDRSVYIPDLPGCGHSDPPAQAIGIGDYAIAVGEMLRGLRLREIDVLGVGVGAAVAVELALWFGAGLRRVVLAQLPSGAPAPPILPQADGSHLLTEWQRGLPVPADEPAIARHSRAVGERLAGGEAAQWPVAALADWSLPAQLARLTVPVLVLEQPQASPAAKSLPASARIDAFQGAGLFGESDAERSVRSLREFLDA